MSCQAVPLNESLYLGVPAPWLAVVWIWFFSPQLVSRCLPRSGFFFWPSGALAPRPGIKPLPTALEVQTLNHGPPGKSLFVCLFLFSWVFLGATANYKNLTCFTLLFHFPFRASGRLSIYSAWLYRAWLGELKASPFSLVDCCNLSDKFDPLSWLSLPSSTEAASG